jgi:hypothetical protein
MKSKARVARLFRVAILLALLLGSVAFAATIKTLPAPGSLPYNLTNYGPIGRTQIITQYYNTNGTTNGAGPTNFNQPVFDNDPDPLEPPLEQIGNVDFQYGLFRGTKADGTGTVVGAAILGGFHDTDTFDLGGNFSWLQIFTDNGDPNGKVDGGGFRGKVNGDINAYNANPGWGHDGTEYNYFDIPLDTLGQQGPESVQFETALVCYNGDKTVHILFDFTWGFTWTANADGSLKSLTGNAPMSQASASKTLFDRYFTKDNGLTGPDGNDTPNLLQNIGVGSCHDCNPAPEPSTVYLLGAGILILFRYRKTLRLTSRN